MSYQETLSYLFGLQKFGIKLGLSNMERLLELCGNPHYNLKAVHVAGTNGKGSTAATIASIIKAAGYNVGLYTSPHLIDFSERIKVNGEDIEEDDVVRLTEVIRSKIQGSEFRDELERITFFEFTTVMAILYFVEKGVGLAVIETGMGGRLDATNVIKPLVSVITNISIEHKEYLGDSLEAIAFEKAGIIKEGVPVVTGVEQPEALKVIETACREKGALLYRLGQDFSFQRKGKSIFTYNGIMESFDDLSLSLKGGHQFMNAALALSVVELLRKDGFKTFPQAVFNGIKSVSWPGRLETVSQDPRIILDGAHNPAGAAVLARALEEEYDYQKLYLILGIMADKEIEEILSRLAPMAYEVILSRPRYERASKAADLMNPAKRYNINCTAFEDLKEAIDYARLHAGSKDIIIISGSLFTVGEARDIIIGGKLRYGVQKKK